MTARELFRCDRPGEEIMKYLIDHRDDEDLGLSNISRVTHRRTLRSESKILKKRDILDIIGVKNCALYFRSDNQTYTTAIIGFGWLGNVDFYVCVSDYRTGKAVDNYGYRYDGQRITGFVK